MDSLTEIADYLRLLIGDPKEYSVEELQAIVADHLSQIPDPVIYGALPKDEAAKMTIPDTPLAQAQELDPKYKLRPHLQYLSDRIVKAVADVEQGQNRMLRVSMPPRSGKSTSLSLYLPFWLLRKHPDWKIGMVSYADGLAVSWGRGVRRIIEGHPDRGIKISPDVATAAEWETTDRGGIVSRGINSGYTGLGFDVLIIDDPMKGTAEAHSKAYRNAVWERWSADLYSRLEAPFLVIVIGCLTGEIPVLMADGTEKPIRDIRPGEFVATYENGQITAAAVTDWANQGPDSVYSIRMKSGAVVRANARHPFLTTVNGVELWRRTDQLRPGTSILRATGASGAASHVAPTGVLNLRSAGACACPTTTRPSGLLGIGLRPTTLGRTVRPLSSTSTESPWTTTTPFSKPKVVSARSAETRLMSETLAASESCSWITAMAPGLFAASSATRATSPSGTYPPLSDSSKPLSTFGVTRDEVVEVVPDGYEDVYDLTVDRTENFIAAGLVTHNTRYHEDDFIGRIASTEHEGNPADWEVIELPALATENDILGREPGQPLFSPLLEETEDEAKARWNEIRQNVGTYHFEALYQQRPAPATGAIFSTDWWKYWTSNPANVNEEAGIVYLDPDVDLASATWLDSWDAAFKGTDTSDFVVGQRWARRGPNRYLLAQYRARMSFTETINAMENWAKRDDHAVSPWGHRVHKRLIEDKANGPAIIDVLRKKISGLKPITPHDSKEVRARAVTPEIESGHVYLPYPEDPGNEWVKDVLDEVRDFPHAANDDSVDSLTQALLELRDEGTGMITVPNRQATGRSPLAAAITQRRRPQGRSPLSRVRVPGR